MLSQLLKVIAEKMSDLMKVIVEKTRYVATLELNKRMVEQENKIAGFLNNDMKLVQIDIEGLREEFYKFRQQIEKLLELPVHPLPRSMREQSVDAP